ncbi:MAG: methylenetetrahydrofolate reductase C-terminal domain-containing protein [Anaerolineae bacterium]
MPPMEEARRAPGSEWLKDHPRWLEAVYTLSRQLIAAGYPLLKHLPPPAVERLMVWSEEILKGWIFNCRMCGQCILHSTGMTCPMNCPKNLRNGPCGGVRLNGHCEVIPDMPCVWVQAWERSQRMRHYAGDLRLLQPPVNRALQGTSAWMNMLTGRDAETPPGWA